MGYGKPPDLATSSAVQNARLREGLQLWLSLALRV
jgi:hypothetical protein